MSEKKLDVKLAYRFDNYLMHLLQEVTHKESIELVAFFSDLCKAVATVGYEKRTGHGIRKVIQDFFPGTSIPFQILLTGYPRNRYNPHSRSYEDVQEFDCTAEVGFPESRMYLGQDTIEKITEALMERELLGASAMQLPPFDRPDPKTPKIYKKMMEAICGKAPKKQTKPGYDPGIDGYCRNCGNKPGESWRPCTCDQELKDANAKR